MHDLAMRVGDNDRRRVVSIWSSLPHIGWDVSARRRRGGHVRSYMVSHHYPTTTGRAERPASIELAEIPPWCVPGHREDPDYDDQRGEWLRLEVNTVEHDRNRVPDVLGPEWASVVLDEAAARQLAADLLEWADRPKLHPTAPLPDRPPKPRKP